MLQDYCTKARFLAANKKSEWSALEHAAKRSKSQYDALGFEDGLFLGPCKNGDNERLLLSGHSLWRLMFANAMQRTGLDTDAISIGKFFINEDAKSARHWVKEVFPAILDIEKYHPKDEMTKRILDGERRLRLNLWIAVKSEVGPAAVAKRVS